MPCAKTITALAAVTAGLTTLSSAANAQWVPTRGGVYFRQPPIAWVVPRSYAPAYNPYAGALEQLQQLREALDMSRHVVCHQAPCDLNEDDNGGAVYRRTTRRTEEVTEELSSYPY